MIIGYIRSNRGFRSLLVATHREGVLRYVGELSVGWTAQRELGATVEPSNLGHSLRF